MKYILSRYNQDIEWVKEYTDDFIVYDRSEHPLPDTIKVQNIGSDIYDKLTYIIDHYDSLPNVAVYTKANLFKYISKEEFEAVKNNTCFTPLLTKHHKTKMPVAFYSEDGMYNEVNNYFYLISHPAKYARQIKDIFHMDERSYNKFVPGSNYILTRKDIQKHSKEFYEKLQSFVEWTVYPGDAQLLERNLYYLWGTDTIDGI